MNSVQRKGTLDIPLMLIFSYFAGITAVPWATPIADWISLVISLILLIPFLKKMYCIDKNSANHI